MSHRSDTDSEDSVFQFDPQESLTDGTDLNATRSSTNPNFEREHIPLAPTTTHTEDASLVRLYGRDTGKGKGVSRPVAIHPQSTLDDEHDLFDMSPLGSPTRSPTSSADLCNSTSSSSRLTSSLHGHLSLPTFGEDVEDSSTVCENDSRIFYSWALNKDPENSDEPILGKGKARELPPTLPPLDFAPSELGYGYEGWPSPLVESGTSGPSSYSSGYGSIGDADAGPQQQQTATTSPTTPAEPSIVRRVPSRSRSLSNLSIQSARSFSALSMTNIKLKLGSSKSPSGLARKLFKRREDIPSSPSSAGPGDDTFRLRGNEPDMTGIRQGSCFVPWGPDTKSPRGMIPAVPYSSQDVDLSITLRTELESLSAYHIKDGAVLLKHKGRSYSSPLPFSPLDIVAPIVKDPFEPIPVVIRHSFDQTLPKEIKLQILSSLIALYETTHACDVREGRWTVQKASSSKSKWVGKDKGFRELVKLSRVSKSWQMLVFDGQLWSDFNFSSFPKLPASLLLRVAERAGPFVTRLQLRGHLQLQPSSLISAVDQICLRPVVAGVMPHSQLTTVNLQGCSSLTTRSLHHLLIRAPNLRKLGLKGLNAVTNSTCDVIAVYLSELLSLDMSRCKYVDGAGIHSLATAGVASGASLRLKELRLSGVAHIDDNVMAALGRACGCLEVLDLSYVRDLHNSSLEAFVSCGEDEDVQSVLLSSRDAGRDPRDSTRYRRRITALRHLSLSSCVLLSDIACSNLAHSMPRLEYLEMAGIGADLKNDGIIRLLSTTPFIRKLDLEDATDITDAVLAAITPIVTPDSRPSKASGTPEPGHALEHLCVSYASEVSDDALLALINGCTRLKVLEADNTGMSGAVLKEFVRLSRERQMRDARIIAVDCRGIVENIVRDLSIHTRPRMGWRSYEARKLGYLDGRDKEGLLVGQDECDEERVILKSFYSWQTVDSVKAAREKRRKASSRRVANESSGSTSDAVRPASSGRARWWSPSGRRSSGRTTPAAIDINDRDGCTIM